MTKALVRRVALLVSVLYGATVGVLAITSSAAVGTAAIIGGVLVGIVWMASSWASDAPDSAARS